MIISVISKNAGFYSLLFFAINHYLYAKNNGLNFLLDSSEWLFTYQKGWEDYFQNVDIINNNSNQRNCICIGHHQQIGNFTITEYKNIIKEIYVYNDTIAEKIATKKQELNLTDYDSIFIRRGDKLSGESNYIETQKYLTVLLDKNPNCSTIFLQTDDYNCYLELQQHIVELQLNIKVVTLCKEHTKGGMIIFSCNKIGIEQAINEHVINKDYISSVIDHLRDAVPIDKLNPEQMYEHTLEMLIGIDIVLNSNIAICEYSSNVSRFIKLAHINCDNVFDVLNPNRDIDWNKTRCPAFELHYAD